MSFSLPRFVRRMQSSDLQRYFTARGILLSEQVEWTAKPAALLDSVKAAIEALPEREREQIFEDFERGGSIVRLARLGGPERRGNSKSRSARRSAHGADLLRHDPNGTGQRASQSAADRFLAEGRRVRIALPPEPGVDFNDVLRGGRVEDAHHVAA